MSTRENNWTFDMVRQFVLDYIKRKDREKKRKGSIKYNRHVINIKIVKKIAKFEPFLH